MTAMRAIEAPPGSPAAPAGRTFSPGARVGWAAFTSGYTGLAAGGQDAGASAPPGLAEEARWAYRRAIAVIEQAGLGLADALAMTEYLSPAALPAAAALDKVRPLGVQPAGPPTSSVVVRSLVRPEALFEVR